MICPTCQHENTAEAVICSACATPLPSNIQTGHTETDGPEPIHYSPHLPKGVRLQGEGYAIGELLGQGGFGITYKGGDLSLRRYVAIKEFFPQGCRRQNSTVIPNGSLSADDYAVVRDKFVEEARILGQFSDPSIVRVFDVFEENNTAYMVMEFLEGQTLSARISERGTLDEAEVINIAEKVGHALGIVHEAGLIHRDIKPDNICLTKDGRVVLIDFGTARSFTANKTVKHTTMLTAGYAPLEQYGQQARFGPPTDIYALAATLYHALAGQLPTSAPDRASGVQLQAPHALNSKISVGLSQTLVRAMSVKASERSQDIRDFLRQLQAPAATTPSSVESWFYNQNGQRIGPLSRETMRKMVRSGTITPATMIWREGWTNWVSADQSEWSGQIGVEAGKNKVARPQIPIRERLKTAISSQAGRRILIGILVLFVARGALGVVRYQNGSRDFSQNISTQVLETHPGAGLGQVNLELAQGTLDTSTQTRLHDTYLGKVRFRDGDVGDISLNVTSRDWLNRPATFQFVTTPTNFGYVMTRPLLRSLSSKIPVGAGRSWLRSLHLQRQERDSYYGRILMYDAKSRAILSGGTLNVTVTSFNTDGSPATWTYTID
ncbi:DUF4339 domain-containing protein [bacterium]|nr:MAG: DUF4339 domain-containing protein [bacterium]